MRKLIVLSFTTLDGVMQAPGGPGEDESGGFRYGGWTYPFFDEFSGKEMIDQIDRPIDLLLGRKTYEIFASYWPLQDITSNPVAASFAKACKYVVSKSLKKADWDPSCILSGNAEEEIRNLKNSEGRDLQVHGSGNLIQTLWKYDLVDELWLKIFPVVVGSGKKLFEDGGSARNFVLTGTKTSPGGVIFANYKRLGEVRTGTVGSQ
jgi:dihydrofolate reductase